ncbi:hypothetical protein SteCoe_16277 [Stentor coeruleus]|uniref:Uncharacterized protein n=1 Tax=Stentor coeruleus TaxID=5963 RepID=A0A1R2C1F9_9CILI|nr:hypothetical protein SteCoe_16277 [Stentor coeruleus]
MQEYADVYSKEISTMELFEQNKSLQNEIDELKKHYEKLIKIRENLIKLNAQEGRILKRKPNRSNYDN